MMEIICPLFSSILKFRISLLEYPNKLKLITLNDVTCEKYYSKYRCKFNVSSHANIINDLKMIEENILKKYSVPNKTPQYKIFEQIKNGYIKIFFDIEKKPETLFNLKISGIWETDENYGLTYKFTKIN
jgi:uncharacterized CHY-type Zn-finger protein